VAIHEEIGGLRLTWEPDGGPGHSYDVVGYKIYRGTHEGRETFLRGVLSDTLTYLDEEVDPETTYYYRVTSYNEYGESLLENAGTANTESWDWDKGLATGDYALIASAIVIVVLVGLLLLQREWYRKKRAEKEP
jgi:hypothetical protein